MAEDKNNGLQKNVRETIKKYRFLVEVIRFLKKIHLRLMILKNHGSKKHFIQHITRQENIPHVDWTPNKKKIVLLSTYPIYPRESGGQIRAWHLAKALNKQGYEVSILSFTHYDQKAKHTFFENSFYENTILIPNEVSQNEMFYRQLMDGISITDIFLSKVWTQIPEFVDSLIEEVKTATAGMLAHPYLSECFQATVPQMPTILDAHNDEYLLKEMLFPKNKIGVQTLEEVNRIERNAFQNATAVTVTTEEDKKSLEERYGLKKIFITPNGVDTKSFEFTSGGDRLRRRKALLQDINAPEDKTVVLFVGSGHNPNVEAGNFLIKLSDSLDDIHIVLCGKHSELTNNQYDKSKVTKLGIVKEEFLKQLLAACDIAVNPVIEGGGSNLKIITYLSSGVPVITTKFGGRGFDNTEAAVFLAKRDGFVDAIHQLAKEPIESERARAGRLYVETNRDWVSVGNQFSKYFEEQIKQ